MAVNSVSSSSRIELLSKENFDTWSMQMEALLIKNDLWDYVNGTCAMPTECDAAAKALWLKNDKKAKADLVLSIQPSELKQVRGCDTSRDVWLKLESIYASKGPARKATLLKQLMLQKLDEGGNVKEHIATFFDAVDKLESMSVPINGDLLLIMLLYSLPSSYENRRCAIESRDELPKADILKIKIIEESEARKQASGSAVIAMAAVERIHAHKKFTKSKDKFTPKHNFKCFKCGAFGHKASACKTRKGDSANRGKQQDQEVNESYAACYTAAEHTWRSEHSFRSKHDWVLDSGCTAHLCGDISNFSSIDKSTKVKLNLASQACAEVKGKGKVKLAVAGYGGEQLIEFNNTLFEPDLRTNLISVAKITNKGHTVTFVKNGAYVSDENGKTILVADRKGDLFFVREGNECAIAEVRCSE